jgi:hypothetical protein
MYKKMAKKAVTDASAAVRVHKKGQIRVFEKWLRILEPWLIQSKAMTNIANMPVSG